MKKLLKLGVNPNFADILGKKPLHLIQSLEALVVLLEYVPVETINDSNNFGETPMLAYLKFNQITRAKEEPIVLEMIANGADVRVTDQSGFTALHLVLSESIAKILIENGANVNARNNLGETPAHMCFSLSKTGIFKLLITNNETDLLVTTNRGVSLLNGLVSLKESDFNEILPALLNRSVEFDMLFKLHWNSPTFSYNSSIFFIASNPLTNYYCLYKLLEMDEVHDSSDIRLTDGNMAFIWLIAKGAHKNERKNKDKLMYRPMEAGEKVYNYFDWNIKNFLAAGANLEMKDRYGTTALYQTLSFSGIRVSAPCQATLIKAGVNYRYITCFGDRPLDATIFKCLYEFKEV